MLAPCFHGDQNRVEGAALGRKQILGARGMIGVETAGEDAVGGQFLDAGGEDAGGEAGKAGFKVLEAPCGMEEEISEDEDGPAVTDDVESARDGAAHGVFSGHELFLRRLIAVVASI